MKGSHAVVLPFLALLMMPPNATAQDDFYVERLQSGRIDYAAGRVADAEQDFRVAAFGLTDRPPLYAEALARLAVADERVGREDAAAESVARFVELERTTPVYATLAVEEPVREAFDALIRELPAATVAGVPALESLRGAGAPAPEAAPVTADLKDTRAVLADLAELDRAGDYDAVAAYADRAIAGGADRIAVLSFRAHAAALRGRCADALADFRTLGDAIAPNEDLVADKFVCLVDTQRWNEAEKLSASVAANRTDAGRAQKALAEHEAKAAPKPQAKPKELPPPAVPAAPANTKPPLVTAVPEPVPDARMLLAKSGALLEANRAPEALALLEAVVASDPGNRAARRMLLEAATLSKQFPLAASQVPHLGPFMTGEEVTMFYGAVAMYETGRLAEARQLLERARPAISASPYVDAYVAKIAPH